MTCTVSEIKRHHPWPYVGRYGWMGVLIQSWLKIHAGADTGVATDVEKLPT